MKKIVVLIICLLIITATIVLARPMARIFNRGIGWDTCTIDRVRTFNTAAPLDANELARKPYDYVTPACAPKYFVWNGSNVVEADQAAKDSIDAYIAQKEDEAKDAQATQEGNLPYIKALVKVINLRLQPGEQITGPEVKAAIKAEL